jgi:hypothetical protein
VCRAPLTFILAFALLPTTAMSRTALADGGPQPDSAPASVEEEEGLASTLERALRRKQTACGINALYLFLRAHGRPVSYQQVDRLVQEGERGANLRQLSDVATALGLATRVRRCSMADLERSRFPVIAHLKEGINPQKMPDDPEVPADPVGYFVLVSGMNDQVVRIIDGNLGDAREWMRVKFPLYWSGYVLELVTSGMAWELWAAALLIPAAWAAVAFALLRRRLVGLRARLSSSIAGLVTVWVALAHPPQGRPAESVGRDSSSAGIWRTTSHDGVNCLYLELSVLGHPVDYQQLEAAVQPQRGSVSLRALQQVARRHGVPMRIRQCSPDRLESLPMPVIAFLDEPRGGGRFVLVCRLDKQRCDLIVGSTATYSEVSIDDFRRDWSGFVLEPADHAGAWLPALSVGFVVIAGYFAWQLRHGTTHAPARPAGVPDARRVCDRAETGAI